MVREVNRAIDECLSVALNGRKRRSQLMRNVDDEIFSYALQAFECRVLVLQLLHGALEFRAGFVELAPEQPEFTAFTPFQPHLEVAVRKFTGEIDDCAEAARKPARDECGDEPDPMRAWQTRRHTQFPFDHWQKGHRICAL